MGTTTGSKGGAGGPAMKRAARAGSAGPAAGETDLARLAAIVESSDDAIIGKSLDGVITSWNPGAEKLYGYTEEEAIGRTMQLVIPPDRREEFGQHLERIRKGEAIETFETVRRRRDGRDVVVSLKISPIRDSDGRIAGSSVIARDITEQKRMQDALREREKDLADFFAQSPLGLLWVNPEGRILRANRAQAELVGREQADVVGRPVSDFFLEPEVAAGLLQSLLGGDTIRDFRARLRHKDGSITHVLIDANGSRTGDVLQYSRWFARDISRRVELEREILGIAEEERRRLGHDLHDDLCQQLSGIEFLTQTLASELDAVCARSAASAREIAELLRRSIDAARELAHGLSPVGVEKEGLMTALGDLALRTCKVFGRDCRFSCHPPVIVGDHALSIHLYRIAQEAVNNAVRHGKARNIEIALAETDNRIVVAVRDDGIGLPRKPLNRKGLGMRIMHYRAGVIDGSLAVQRLDDGGTEVVCAVKRPGVATRPGDPAADNARPAAAPGEQPAGGSTRSIPGGKPRRRRSTRGGRASPGESTRGRRPGRT